MWAVWVDPWIKLEVGDFNCGATSFQTSNLTCAEPNAWITIIYLLWFNIVDIVHGENELSPSNLYHLGRPKWVLSSVDEKFDVWTGPHFTMVIQTESFPVLRCTLDHDFQTRSLYKCAPPKGILRSYSIEKFQYRNTCTVFICETFSTEISVSFSPGLIYFKHVGLRFYYWVP